MWNFKFFLVRNTDAVHYYYEKSLGVCIEIQGASKVHYYYPLEDRQLSIPTSVRLILDELILFIIHESQEIDVSSFIDKLRNKKRTIFFSNYKDDEKEILNFISLFQSKIANARIISYSKIDFNEIKFKNHTTIYRIFDFEIVF